MDIILLIHVIASDLNASHVFFLVFVMLLSTRNFFLLAQAHWRSRMTLFLFQRRVQIVACVGSFLFPFFSVVRIVWRQFIGSFPWWSVCLGAQFKWGSKRNECFIREGVVDQAAVADPHREQKGGRN